MIPRFLANLSPDLSGLALLHLLPPLLAAIFCFWSVFALAGVLGLNKGAKFNRSIGLMAIGLAFFGFARAQDFMSLLGLAKFPRASALGEAVGALLVLAGALYARGIFKRLMK